MMFMTPLCSNRGLVGAHHWVPAAALSNQRFCVSGGGVMRTIRSDVVTCCRSCRDGDQGPARRRSPAAVKRRRIQLDIGEVPSSELHLTGLLNEYNRCHAPPSLCSSIVAATTEPSCQKLGMVLQGNRPATELPSAAIRELLSNRAPLLAARGAPPERLRAQLPLPADDVVRCITCAEDGHLHSWDRKLTPCHTFRTRGNKPGRHQVSRSLLCGDSLSRACTAGTALFTGAERASGETPQRSLRYTWCWLGTAGSGLVRFAQQRQRCSGRNLPCTISESVLRASHCPRVVDTAG